MRRCAHTGCSVNPRSPRAPPARPTRGAARKRRLPGRRGRRPRDREARARLLAVLHHRVEGGRAQREDDPPDPRPVDRTGAHRARLGARVQRAPSQRHLVEATTRCPYEVELCVVRAVALGENGVLGLESDLADASTRSAPKGWLPFSRARQASAIALRHGARRCRPCANAVDDLDPERRRKEAGVVDHIIPGQSGPRSASAPRRPVRSHPRNATRCNVAADRVASRNSQSARRARHFRRGAVEVIGSATRRTSRQASRRSSFGDDGNPADRFGMPRRRQR